VVGNDVFAARPSSSLTASVGNLRVALRKAMSATFAVAMFSVLDRSAGWDPAERSTTHSLDE